MKKLNFDQIIALPDEEQRLYLLEVMETYPGVSMSDMAHGMRTKISNIRDLFAKHDLHLYTDRANLSEETISKNKKAFIGFMLAPPQIPKKEKKSDPEEKGFDTSKWVEEQCKKPTKSIVEEVDGDLQVTIKPDKPVEALKFVPFGEYSFKLIDLGIVHEIVDTMIGMTDGDVNTMKIRIEGREGLSFDMEKKRSKNESLSEWIKGILTYINDQNVKVDLWFVLS